MALWPPCPLQYAQCAYCSGCLKVRCNSRNCCGIFLEGDERTLVCTMVYVIFIHSACPTHIIFILFTPLKYKMDVIDYSVRCAEACRTVVITYNIQNLLSIMNPIMLILKLSTSITQYSYHQFYHTFHSSK